MIRPREPSYRKVNYLLRLRKQIERKMMIDTINKIDKLLKLNIENYLYLGLGSIFFADFILFHKYLDIKDMISLELPPEEVKGQPMKERFYFNKPFKFIGIEFIRSTNLLKMEEYEIRDEDGIPRWKFSWNKPLIIWFDYDYELTTDTAKEFMIRDLETVGNKAKKWDFFIVTIECWKDDDTAKSTIEIIKDYLKIYNAEKLDEEIERLPKINEDVDYDPRISAKILNDFVWGCIDDGISKRSDREDIDFLQIFYFYYVDTTPMYTFGCLFIPANEKEKIKKTLEETKIGVYNRNVYNRNDDPFPINCPILTPKEKYHLDSCIRYTDSNQIDMVYRERIGLPDEYITNYKKFYKYYPQFFEAIY